MSDIHSINEAINKKAGRKLLPSIAVGLSLIALVWFALSYQREVFAIVVAVAVILGLREIVRAFAARSVTISFNGLTIAAIGLAYAAWNGGVGGLAVATAIAIPLLLIRALIQGPEGFVAKATATTFSLLYLPFLAGFLILLAIPSTGFQRVMTFMVLVGCNDTFGYIIGVLFGKHPLVPTISPKKTWEGLIGSIIFTSNLYPAAMACTHKIKSPSETENQKQSASIFNMTGSLSSPPLKSTRGVYIACPIEHFLIFLGVKNWDRASASGPLIWTCRSTPTSHSCTPFKSFL